MLGYVERFTAFLEKSKVLMHLDGNDMPWEFGHQSIFGTLGASSLLVCATSPEQKAILRLLANKNVRIQTMAQHNASMAKHRRKKHLLNLPVRIASLREDLAKAEAELEELLEEFPDAL